MAEKNSRGKVKPPYQVRLERDLALARQERDEALVAAARHEAMYRGAQRGAESLRAQRDDLLQQRDILGAAVFLCVPGAAPDAALDTVAYASQLAAKLDAWRQAQGERIGELTSEVSRLRTLACNENIAANTAQDERHCALAVVEKLLHALELAPGEDRERVLLDALTQMRHLPPFV